MMLVLSLFPGIGLLDMAFEEEGFCVVRGPDLLWGGDVRRFHPPAGKFDGVIGGPPCQAFSPLVNVNAAMGREPAEDMIPEFKRVVRAVKPTWFLMENVVGAPLPDVDGYHIDSLALNNRWFGAEQNRLRRFTYGTRRALVNSKGAHSRPATLANPWRHLEVAALEHPVWEPAVCASVGGRRRSANPNGIGHQKRVRVHEAAQIAKGRPLWRDAELQGLPRDFDIPAFTAQAKKRAIGNGVPLPMGRAIARAVKRAVMSEHAPASAERSEDAP